MLVGWWFGRGKPGAQRWVDGLCRRAGALEFIDCPGMGFVLLGVGMERDRYEVFEWNMARLKERRVGGFVSFESVDMRGGTGGAMWGTMRVVDLVACRRGVVGGV